MILTFACASTCSMCAFLDFKTVMDCVMRQRTRAYIFRASRLSMLERSGRRALKKPATILRCLLFPFFSYVAMYWPIQVSNVVWTFTTAFGSILPTMDNWAPRTMKQVARSFANAIDGPFELSSPSNTSLYAWGICQRGETREE